MAAAGSHTKQAVMKSAGPGFTATPFTTSVGVWMPSGVNFFSHEVMAASLDHAMWFHDRVRVDQWLWYEIDAPRAARSRGLNRGSFYTREGTLIASTVQEGLMRVGEPRT